LVTQADIARRAGVARATVSRIFSGDQRVSPQTMQKVLRVAEELGYVHPRAEKKRRKLTVIACEGTMGSKLVEGHFFMQIIAGISDFCRRSDLMSEVITLRREPGDQLVKEFEEIVRTSRPDGVILPSVIPVSKELLEPLLRDGSPLVLVNRYLESHPVDCVVNDDLWVGRYAANLLVEHGHRHIGYIGGVTRATAVRDRYCGFRDVLLDAGLFNPSYCSFHEHLTVEAGYEGMRRILEGAGKLTAVFCANDETAIGAIRAIQESGRAVPGDVSVVGHDGLMTQIDRQTSLTSFRFRLYELGYSAAQLLFIRMQNPDFPRQRVVIRPEFLAGDTVSGTGTGK